MTTSQLKRSAATKVVQRPPGDSGANTNTPSYHGNSSISGLAADRAQGSLPSGHARFDPMAEIRVGV